MSILVDVEIEDGPVRVLPVPATSADVVLLTGRGSLLGWSLRDVTAHAEGETQGSVTSPAALAAIVTTPALPGGAVHVGWTVALAGAAAAADADNFQILHNGAIVARAVNAGAPGIYPQAEYDLDTQPGDTVSITAIAAGVVGAIYTGVISIQSDNLPYAVVELQDGDNPIGEISVDGGGTDSRDFSPSGIRIVNTIRLHVVSGIIQGAVYARYAR